MSTSSARELADYLDEPKQLPSGSPGKDAFLRLGFERRGERTILRELARRAPLIVQQALYWDEAMPDLPCVFIISNAGGILQGDRYTIEIKVGPQARAHVTTQAATKIHRMDANYATQTQSISLEQGAYLEYLPDPVIPHCHARFMTQTNISIAEGATLLYSEILAGGRKYHNEGELFQYDVFSSTVRADRKNGHELFTEKFVVEPWRDEVRRNGVLGEYDLFANVLLLTPREHADRIFEQVPAEIDRDLCLAAGVSRLPNDAGLVYKVLGTDTENVKSKVRHFWSLVRKTVVGCELMGDFAWR